MSSETDVISQLSTIISVDDPKIQDLPYGPGDLFLFDQSVVDSEWNSELALQFKDASRVGEVVGIAVSIGGDINYCLEFSGSGYEPTLRWTLNLRELNAWFIHVGRDETEVRFMLLNE